MNGRGGKQGTCRAGCWAGVFALAGVAMLVLPVRAGEMRTWTDSSGKHKLEAEFVELQGFKAVLRKPDGTKFQIEMGKLSHEDRAYVLRQKVEESASPFEKVQEESEPDRPLRAGGGAKDTGKAAEAIDWSKAETVAVTPTGDWKFSAPEIKEKSPRKGKPVLLPPTRDFFEGLASIAASAPSQRVVLSYNFEKAPPEQQTRVVLCDLAQGKAITALGPGLMNALALNDEGTRVVMCRNEFGFGKHDRLEVWSIGRGSVSRQYTWCPYGDLDGADRDVPWAAFLDGNRLATFNHSGKIVVWDMESHEPVFHLQSERGWAPAVSPDRKYLAFLAGSHLEVLDVKKPEVVAAVTIPELQGFGRLAFSPAGTRLGLMGWGKLLVWKFDSGELYREVLLTKVHGDVPQWTSEHHVLVGNVLIDVDNQIKLWEYQGLSHAAVVGGMPWLVVSGGHNQPATLLPQPLPHVGVEERLAKAMGDPNFFVLKPGTTVRLNVEALPDAPQRDAIRAGLTARIEEQGFKAGQEGTIELVASAEAGEEKEVAYHTFGAPGLRVYKIRVYASRLKFVYQGKTLWEISCTNIPGMVRLKEGQTIEQYLREQERPNYDWFGGVELPKILANTQEGETIGKSLATPAGMVDPAARPHPFPIPKRPRGRAI